MSLQNFQDEARALRALAHPLRLRLLDAIASEGQLTSTGAAERTGESTANCSFHLRLLAKYGFVEEAAGADRRERPWRLAQVAPVSLGAWPALPFPEAARARAPEPPVRQLRIFDPDRLGVAA